MDNTPPFIAGITWPSENEYIVNVFPGNFVVLPALLESR